MVREAIEESAAASERSGRAPFRSPPPALIIMAMFATGCAPAPEDVLAELGQSMGADAILRVESLVAIDRVAASIVDAVGAGDQATVAQMIREGLDRGQ
jgi:hypothetical protein